MIQLLTGENDFEIRAARERAIFDFTRRHSADGVTVVDGTAVSRDELPQLLLGANLFAPERLVVIDSADAIKDTWEKLAEYLPEVGESTEVVLVAPKADKRTKLYKWLHKNGDIVTAKLLDGPALIGWLQTEAREAGIELSAELVRYIIDYAGADQWQLRNNVQKLALSGQPMTRELIRDVLIPHPQASAFELLDAALSGRKEGIDELLAGVKANEDPYRFFGLLANQVYALVVVAAAGNRPADAVAKETALHPFVVRKTATLVRKLGPAQTARLAETVATCDMQLKSSGAEPWTLITAALKNIAA